MLDIGKDDSFYYLEHAQSLGISTYACGRIDKLDQELVLHKRTIDYFALSHVYEGSGWFQSANSGKLEIQKGDCFLLFPGEWHSYGPYPDGFWKEYWVFFGGSTIRSLLNEGHLRVQRPHFRAIRSEKILQLFKQIYECAASKTTDSQQDKQISAWVFELLNELVNFSHEMPAHSSQTVVQQIIAQIVEQPQQEWDFKSLAQQYYMSYGLLRLRFSEITGTSPHRFLNQERVRLACRFLTEGNSVKDTCSAIGMQDPYHFSRLFKQIMGLSPKAFSKSIQDWKNLSDTDLREVSDALKVTQKP